MSCKSGRKTWNAGRTGVYFEETRKRTSELKRNLNHDKLEDTYHGETCEKIRWTFRILQNTQSPTKGYQ